MRPRDRGTGIEVTATPKWLPPELTPTPEQAEADTAVESVEESPGPVISDESDPVQPPPRGRPSLKIVK